MVGVEIPSTAGEQRGIKDKMQEKQLLPAAMGCQGHHDLKRQTSLRHIFRSEEFVCEGA